MPVHNPPIVKQSFTANMNYYSRSTDSDLEWLVVNQETNFKLGTADVVVNDTATVTISGINQRLIRSVWFLAPFDMTVTDITGIVQDDDFSNHADTYYIGIWVMTEFGSGNDTPAAETGANTLTLKYVTQDYAAPSAVGANSNAMGFSDSSPSLSLSAGDAVWAGHLQKRFDGNDDMTLTMTLCGEKD